MYIVYTYTYCNKSIMVTVIICMDACRKFCKQKYFEFFLSFIAVAYTCNLLQNFENWPKQIEQFYKQ